jgi:IS5 family transposase
MGGARRTTLLPRFASQCLPTRGSLIGRTLDRKVSMSATFGYKNHVNADKHKLIRHYAVSDAAVHDSQKLDGLLDKGNTCNDVFAAKECRPPCLA